MSEYRQTLTAVTCLVASLAEAREYFSVNKNLPPPPPSFAIPTFYTSAALSALTASTAALAPAMELYASRLTAVDPVTGADRYGDNMKVKVKDLLAQYAEVTAAVDGELPAILVHAAALEAQAAENARVLALAQAEASAAAAAAAANSEAALELKRQEEERQREAEEIREREAALARIHAQHAEEERLKQEEIARDRAWFDAIDKTPAGFKANFALLPPAARKIVTQLFTQMKQHPENETFRKIKLDNPKFQADIAVHDGGKEVFVSAGFKLLVLESESGEVSKCLILAEPNLENDFDGWSEWYDGLKACLEICESFG